MLLQIYTDYVDAYILCRAFTISVLRPPSLLECVTQCVLDEQWRQAQKKKNTWYFVTNDVTASKRASVSILQRQMLQINLESSTFFLIWYAAFWTFTERNGWKSDKKKKLREGRWKWEKSVQQLVANIRITVDLYLSKLQQVAFLFLINLKNVRNIISHERSMHIYPSSTECRLFDHD